MSFVPYEDVCKVRGPHDRRHHEEWRASADPDKAGIMQKL